MDGKLNQSTGEINQGQLETQSLSASKYIAQVSFVLVPLGDNKSIHGSINGGSMGIRSVGERGVISS